MRIVVLAAALVCAAAGPAGAQGQAQGRWYEGVFVNVNGLAQTSSRDVPVRGSFALYDEVATFEGRREIGGGGVFDISAGLRDVWRDLAVSIGYSRFGDSSGVDITALVPDRLVPNSPHQQVLTAGQLDHTENAVHLSVVWFWPFIEKVDVAVSGGPSIFNVNQDTVTITEANVESGTSTLTGINRTKGSDTAVGFNLGVDVTYMVTRRIGAGALLRYAAASGEIAGVSVDVGGLQVGAGVRVRF